MSAERGPAASMVVLGAGGHARVLRELIEEAGGHLDGYVSPTAEPGLPGLAWLGDDEALSALDPAAVSLVNGIGSVDVPVRRKNAYVAAVARGFRFPSLVDSAASVRRSAVLGDGVQVLPGAVVGSGVVIHEDVILNSGVVVEHNSVIGAHSHLSPGVTVAGGVTIGECVHVGIGATVVQGVTIGSDSIVGAGAVVIRDVPPGSIAVGVPAVTRQRASEEPRG